MVSAILQFLTGNPLGRFLALFVLMGFVATVFRGFLRARKIQPNAFRWRAFLNEILFGALNLAVSAFALGSLTAWLTTKGWIAFNTAPASWWVIGLEYALY